MNQNILKTFLQTILFQAFRSIRSIGRPVKKLFNYLRKMSLRITWQARYARRRRLSRLLSEHHPDYELSILPVFFINLDSRLDRRQEIEKELANAGFRNVTRFTAVEDSPGILGCSRSHRDLLTSLTDEQQPVMICEDDVEFLTEPEKIWELIRLFFKDPSLDVLCIANNPKSKPVPVGEKLSIVNDTRTTACYILKPGTRHSLIRVFEESVRLLEKGRSPRKFALDVVWRKVQQRGLIFAIPTEKVARQRPSFSDVEMRWVDYNT